VPLDPEADIASSSGRAFALTDRRIVWGWGSNTGHGLGTDSGSRTTPAPVEGLTNVRRVYAYGERNSALDAYCAVRNDGSVWCWGDTTRSPQSQFTYLRDLTNTTGDWRALPLPFMTDVEELVMGAACVHHTSDGSVDCWRHPRGTNFALAMRRPLSEFVRDRMPSVGTVLQITPGRRRTGEAIDEALWILNALGELCECRIGRADCHRRAVIGQTTPHGLTTPTSCDTPPFALAAAIREAVNHTHHSPTGNFSTMSPLRRSMLLTALALCASISASSCAPVEELAEDGTTDDELRVAATPYVRVRRDTRRCVSPICGGYWVSRVNQRTLRCVDGTLARECYVSEIDFSGLGLSDTALASFEERPFILRARITPRTHPLGTFGVLVAQEGWSAVTNDTPDDTVYLTHGPARTCVRAPCPAYDATKLNGITAYQLTDVTLSSVAGVSRTDVLRGTTAMRTLPGILVAGTVRSSGERHTLTASQFYLRVSPGVSDAVYCDTDTECTVATRSREVRSSADCYCALCPNTPMNVSTAERYSNQYDRYCTAFRRTCPVARCIQPLPVVCVNHACQYRGAR
jgi:hypothetical protein